MCNVECLRNQEPTDHMVKFFSAVFVTRFFRVKFRCKFKSKTATDNRVRRTLEEFEI